MEKEQPTKFSYRNIELYKSKSLGSGSYGGVCKAKCDGLLCAAKIMHPTLFDLRDPGTVSYLSRFWEECHLLSLARHPNVVQYLGMHIDSETQLPVLLMELCEESLTSFLERSPGPLSYHIQVDICHDIALALVYLHSNGLIHRDLTGNNILMIAGPRAKITDFGMSKLARANPRMTTLCPGNVLYMSPEALDEAITYTAKLDIFSFGVLMIQVLTRQFPNPTNRFRTIPSGGNRESADEDDETSEVRQLVPETERRESHLKLIPDAHFLRPLILQCLKKREKRRPSAFELSERLSELKELSQYIESRDRSENSRAIQKPENTSDIERMLGDKNREIHEQHLTIQTKDRLLNEKDQEIQAKARENQEQKREIQAMVVNIIQKDQEIQAKARENQEQEREIQAMVVNIIQKDREIQVNVEEIQEKKREVQEQQRMITSQNQALEKKESLLRKLVHQLRASEELVSEFQQSLQQKDKIISDRERKISQLEQQDIASQVTPQQQPVSAPQPTGAGGKSINKMKSTLRRDTPEAMYRGATAVFGNKAYFRTLGSHKVYSYSYTLGYEQWIELPDNMNKEFGLAVIGGFLTSVGGWNDAPVNTLLSIESGKKVWSEIFPPMTIARSSPACVTSGDSLVVVGGLRRNQEEQKWCNVVEVMNTDAKQWSMVNPLPRKFEDISATMLGDRIYLVAGGCDSSVITCSLPDLLQQSHTTLASKLRQMLVSIPTTTWKEISNLPLTGSTLISFGNDLLAIGGRDDVGNLSAGVYRYNSHSDSWTHAREMWSKRSHCLAVAIQETDLVVVGGFSQKTKVGYSVTKRVEVFI